MNKNNLINLLEKSKKESFEFQEKYQGPGFKKQISRIFKYKLLQPMTIQDLEDFIKTKKDIVGDNFVFKK